MKKRKREYKMEKAKITISTSLLSLNDVETISNDDITVKLLPYAGFSPADIILILIEISKDISVNALYDSLKYAFIQIFKKMSSNSSNEVKEFKLKINNNGKTFSLEMELPINDQQCDKVVEAVINKISEYAR